MMTKKSYDKEFLPASQKVLGAMIDVATYYLGYSPEKFFEKFLRSSYPRKIESGDPFTVWGKSGTEIAFDIAGKDIGEYKERLEQNGLILHRSPEYWAGWSLAYYQWYSNKKFDDINKLVGFSRVLGMYSPYHEMDILQFCDKMDEITADRTVCSRDRSV